MKTFLVLLLASSVYGNFNQRVEYLPEQYSAQMTLSRQMYGGDGLAARQIFRGVRLQEGDRILLKYASGVSIFRIHKGKNGGSDLCPTKWTIEYVDRNGRIVESDSLENYLGRPQRVPWDAVAAYIGYEDSSYFDNEGIRWTQQGSTRGCTFEFKLFQNRS